MNTMNNNKEQPTHWDKVAARIASGILKVQVRFANSLYRVTKGWQQKQQWIFLCTVFLIAGSLSLAVMIIPFQQTAPPDVIVVKAISYPKSIYRENQQAIITDKEFEKIREYRSKHPDLQHEMPGLFDSLQQAEAFYYSQKNKQDEKGTITENNQETEDVARIAFAGHSLSYYGFLGIGRRQGQQQ